MRVLPLFRIGRLYVVMMVVVMLGRVGMVVVDPGFLSLLNEMGLDLIRM